MKLLKNFLLLGFLTISFLSVKAQDCDTKLSMYYEFYKAKKYDLAFEPWKDAFNSCPTSGKNLYIHGVRIVTKKIKASTSESEKNELKTLLMKVYNQRLENFPQNKGYVNGLKAADMMKYNIGNDKEVFDILKGAFAEQGDDLNSRSVYAYFLSATNLLKANQLTTEDIFKVYEESIASVEKNINTISEKAGILQMKKDSENNLTSKEEKRLKRANIERKNFNIIKVRMEKLLAPLATCDKLIPMFEGKFEENKNDVQWLRSTGGLLYSKDCTGSSLFSKMVDALHKINPSASSARGLAARALKSGDYNSAIQYLEQSSNLEEDKYKKANNYMRIASIKNKQGKKSSAKSYALKAANLKPGWGTPYLLIASMYGSSANSCGKDEFTKRATYWAAADMAAKAKRIDPSVSSKANKMIHSYNRSAPDKKLSFQTGHSSGQSIRLGCWIGTSVTVR